MKNLDKYGEFEYNKKLALKAKKLVKDAMKHYKPKNIIEVCALESELISLIFRHCVHEVVEIRRRKVKQKKMRRK